MNNKTQILCNCENKRRHLLMKNCWKNIKINFEQISELKELRQDLILQILMAKQRGLLVPNYIFMSLSNAERHISVVERAIKIRKQEIIYFSKKLVIC